MKLFAGGHRARWGAALLALALLAGCKTELLTGLSQRQANEAIALLLRNNIDAQKQDIGKGRFRIEVGREEFSDAVHLLEKHQLPSREDVSIAELFPADSFVNSPATERARLISGLEQRLEQTARAVDHVLSARVHISYPMSDKNNADQPVHVSMMLNYDGPLSDTLLIQRLKQLVKNSFEDLSYENISVVIFHVTEDEVDIVRVSKPVMSFAWGWAIAGGGALLIVLAMAGGVFWRRRRAAAARAAEEAEAA